MIRPSGEMGATTRWLLIGLILIAFGRGIWALGGKSLWWDESLSLHRADRTLAYALSNQIVLTDNTESVVTIDNHPPVYFTVLWAGVQLFGRSEFSLRYLSLASVVLLVPLLFAAGRRLVGTKAGLAAAALGALSPMYLWYGQEARPYAMLTLFGLLSFYLFVLLSTVAWDRKALHRYWLHLASYILVSTFVVFTHYLGSLLIAFELLVWGWMFLQRARHRRVLAPIIAILLLVSVSSLVYALVTLPQATSRAGFRFLPLWELLRDLMNSFSLGLSVDVGTWYVLLIDFVFLAVASWGWWRLVRPGSPRSWRMSGWLLLGYLIIPIGVIYLLSYFQPAYMNSRHLMLITPAFYLLAGSGLTAWRRRTAVIALAAGVVILGGIAFSTYNYFSNSTYDKDHHREWGEYLRDHVRPGDVVVVNPPHIADLYQYYADSGADWVGLPLLSGSRQNTVAKLEQLLADYDRVWLAMSHTPPWGDPRNTVVKWLNRNAFRTEYRSFKSYASILLLSAYQRDWPSIQDLPDDAQRVDVEYGPALHLLGYRTLAPARSGEPLHLELFWSVEKPIDQEASVALRLVDEKGHVWGQNEECPYDGLYPMWQWTQGTRLPVPHQLTVSPGTPPGKYQLEMVLVSRPTEDGCLGERGGSIAPVSAEPGRIRGDRVYLGPVDVDRSAVEPSMEEPDMQNRQRVRFGGLELLGADLAPGEIVAGGRSALTLYWRLREELAEDAEFRLRLLDPGGALVHEAVIQPVGTAFPTGMWTVGDVLKGQFWLPIREDAQTGRYVVQLVPQPPLQRAGILAAIERLLGRQRPVRLGSVQVLGETDGEFRPMLAAIPTPSDLAVSHPLWTELGGMIRLLGVDIRSGSVRAGEEVSFTLYWQALQPMEVSYSVFTHLLGPTGEILAQDDGIPNEGSYPTTLWLPGEVIADTYSIQVDPATTPGHYPIEVGMYRLETGKRLPVIDPDNQRLPEDRILLPEIEVLPALPVPPQPEPSFRIYLPAIVRGK